MPGYSDRALPYLHAIAEGVYASQAVRDWLIMGTPFQAAYRGASALIDEQRAVRWSKGQTKGPFWGNYPCGYDRRCTCRIEGSLALESDAIFFFRNASKRILAVHVEFKYPGEPFSFGQAEAYPLRAACFVATHHKRSTMNAHDEWATVLFCGRKSLSDHRISHFHRVITHDDAAEMISSYPTSASRLV